MVAVMATYAAEYAEEMARERSVESGAEGAASAPARDVRPVPWMGIAGALQRRRRPGE